MRLLDTRTAEFRWVDEPRHVSYAILSHVWTKEGQGPPEQSFEDVKKILKPSTRFKPWPAKGKRDSIPPKLSEKIRRCCAVAREHGFDSVWVDSCCIDKTSSSELSEAINSMFNWYQHAKVCYAYLHDVDDEDDPRAPGSQFRRSRWFSRGWTLQELIAPRVLVFLSKGWRVLGTKAMLAMVIEQVTGIDHAILTHEASLDSISVARRLSWAARRQTTREEDEAYSLMGILGVHLPTIYGEGRFAFIRLQEEVLKQTSDQSLFVWGLALRDNVELVDDAPSDVTHFWEEPRQSIWDGSYVRNLFALSPRDFASSAKTSVLPRHSFLEQLRLNCPLSDYTMTSHGIRMTVPVLAVKSRHSDIPIHLAILACQDNEGHMVALIVRNQERTSNEFFVGAHLPPTMTIGDEDLNGGDLSAGGGFLLGELYFRTTRLPQEFLDAHRESIRLQELYIPHRPSRAHAQAFPAYAEVYTALTQCEGPIDVLLTGWCESLLEKEGFAVSPIWHDTAVDLDYPRRRGFFVRKGDRGIHIEFGACDCEEGMRSRWLRVAVSTHLVTADSPEPVVSTQPQRTFAVRHNRHHPDHVSSWYFASGLASKQLHAQFANGQRLTVQLNLSVSSSGDAPHFYRTYALGVEIFDGPSKETLIPVVQHAQSAYRWVPPFVVVDSPPSVQK
ncbi:HET-domain-containing protein [Ganoderma leucocontextum]|nr:HET-domain-containing protein [Ganoderma leucocontextum]